MTIRDDITGMIRERKLACAPVEETSDLYADLGFDSLAFVSLLLSIEESFSISIDLMEMEACLQVERLVALVEHKVKEAGHDSALADRPKKPGENRHIRK